MAMAMKDGDFSKSLEADTDDFEVVSDAHLIDQLSIVSEYGSRGGDGDGRTTENDDVRVIDPLSAFEMIHSEHRLLKDELESQNEMLRHRLESIELHERQKAEEMESLKISIEQMEREKAEEIASLKNNIEAFSMELAEKKTQQMDMERQIKYWKETSENADLLTAKLLEADDVINNQHKMIQQLRGDGYGGAPASPVPAPSTDINLRAEIAQKDGQIKYLEGTLAKLESSLSGMNGERLKAKYEADLMASRNQELQEIVTDLQLQAESDKIKEKMDKAEWDAIRSDLEQQIQVLSDRVLAFENQYTNPSLNLVMNPQATNTNSSPDSGTPTLRHRDQIQYKECPLCHLPMSIAGPHPCPAIVDCLD